jgi:putative membrane protein
MFSPNISHSAMATLAENQFGIGRKRCTNGPSQRTISRDLQYGSGEIPNLTLENYMAKLLAHWILSALCLLLVAHFVPGFFVRGFGTALIAAVVIGLVNGTIGMLLKIITFPLTIITFGIFWLLINALMLKFAAFFVPGFEVRGLWPAFWGGLILSVLNMTIRRLLKNRDE